MGTERFNPHRSHETNPLSQKKLGDVTLGVLFAAPFSVTRGCKQLVTFILKTLTFKVLASDGMMKISCLLHTLVKRGVSVEKSSLITWSSLSFVNQQYWH
jgi:hypothetical protein